ncbi:hypothetical protein NSMM_510001 [Nitrosomonas mobilis]|uniref:Uncharacterized protein n=1 Tax=Nitrosomonas mobilis TaxID=51642 RepID=A0A1G5SGF7_9PROT|nr:hypothetical protein NSMM_510001 [Nitrosomonas mobilis]
MIKWLNTRFDNNSFYSLSAPNVIHMTLLRFYVGDKLLSKIITTSASEALFESDVERQL